MSFLWGAIGPDEISNPVKSLPLSSIAIAYLILGVFGMLLSQRYSTTNGDYKESIADDTTSLLVSESGNAGTVQAVQRDTNAGRLLAGLVCAVLVGCFGGSILVPLSFVPDKYSGIGFLPSFGIGAGGSGFLITSCYLLYHRATAPSLTSIVSKSAPGIAAGVVWNVGNVCSILAMGPAGNLSCRCLHTRTHRVHLVRPHSSECSQLTYSSRWRCISDHAVCPVRFGTVGHFVVRRNSRYYRHHGFFSFGGRLDRWRGCPQSLWTTTKLIQLISYPLRTPRFLTCKHNHTLLNIVTPCLSLRLCNVVLDPFGNLRQLKAAHRDN